MSRIRRGRTRHTSRAQGKRAHESSTCSVIRLCISVSCRARSSGTGINLIVPMFRYSYSFLLRSARIAIRLVGSGKKAQRAPPSFGAPKRSSNSRASYCALRIAYVAAAGEVKENKEFLTRRKDLETNIQLNHLSSSPRRLRCMRSRRTATNTALLERASCPIRA
jgi:hypothetical protein